MQHCLSSLGAKLENLWPGQGHNWWWKDLRCTYHVLVHFFSHFHQEKQTKVTMFRCLRDWGIVWIAIGKNNLEVYNNAWAILDGLLPCFTIILTEGTLFLQNNSSHFEEKIAVCWLLPLPISWQTGFKYPLLKAWECCQTGEGSHLKRRWVGRHPSLLTQRWIYFFSYATLLSLAP